MIDDHVDGNEMMKDFLAILEVLRILLDTVNVGMLEKMIDFATHVALKKIYRQGEKPNFVAKIENPSNYPHQNCFI
jgi:hypothetical protein